MSEANLIKLQTCISTLLTRNAILEKKVAIITEAAAALEDLSSDIHNDVDWANKHLDNCRHELCEGCSE